MRYYAIDLERRFNNLCRREEKLYSDPNNILVEQCIEWVDDQILRNACRDRYEKDGAVKFRDLREFAIRRSGQEESRIQGQEGARQATLRTKR